MALPVATAILMICAALAATAAASAVTATRQSSRDSFVKRAVAAADAGLDVGLYRLNKLATVLSATNQCVVKDATTGVLGVEPVQSDGWCRAQTEDLGDGAAFSYRVSGRQSVTVGGDSVWQRKLVSSGTASGVLRRANTVVNAPTGSPLFAYTVFSDLDFTMENLSRVVGNVRSNGNVAMQHPASICGNVIAGPGKSIIGTGNSCSDFINSVASELFVLNPVLLPPEDENDRITTGLDPSSGNVSWNPATRQLVLANTGELTLHGGTYVLCKLEFHNNTSIVIPDDGTPVKIYMDSPESCGGEGTGSISFQNRGGFDNVSANPAMLQIYAMGSKEIATSVSFQNLHDEQLTVFAPNSIVPFSNNSTLTGAVAAKQVMMQNKITIQGDDRVGSIGGEQPLQLYGRQAWVECESSPAGSTPDSGC